MVGVAKMGSLLARLWALQEVPYRGVCEEMAVLPEDSKSIMSLQTGRRRRKRVAGLALLFVLCLALSMGLASLPWFLGTPSGRQWLLSRANATLAPARLEVGSFAFAWFGPTQMRDFRIYDFQDNLIVEATQADWDRSLWQAITDRSRLGTLSLINGKLDLERDAQGRINLAEALQPILAGDSQSQFRLRLSSISMLVRSPELSHPLQGIIQELEVDSSPADEATTWKLTLDQESEQAGPSRLTSQGILDRSKKKAGDGPRIQFDLVGLDWPLDLEASGIRLEGHLDGKVELVRNEDSWQLNGEASIQTCRLDGPRLQGNQLSLGQLQCRWDASGIEGGDLRFSGRITSGSLTQVDSEGSTHVFDPIAIAASGGYRPDLEEVTLQELVADHPFAKVEVFGQLNDLLSAPRLDLQGMLQPNWPLFSDWLAEHVEPGSQISGGLQTFQVRGPLQPDSADPLAEYQVEAGLELEELDVFGMRLGAMAVAARLNSGALTIDPIETTLNGGLLRVDPVMEREPDGSWIFRLEPGSSLTNAEVNDEVSHRVLSFVAPVLDRATRVQGLVSAEVARAEIPIGPDFDLKTLVAGRVVFQDVAFAPGPLANTLVQLVGSEASTVRLDEPVVLTIADGRVHQRGLAVPVGHLTRIELDGDVGFDRSLNLTASLPITRAMVANRPLLGDIVEGSRISLPIIGSLDDPKVDRDAFQLAIDDLGKSLLNRAAGRGALELLERLSQPREGSDRPRLRPRPNRRERSPQRPARESRRSGNH